MAMFCSLYSSPCVVFLFNICTTLHHKPKMFHLNYVIPWLQPLDCKYFKFFDVSGLEKTCLLCWKSNTPIICRLDPIAPDRCVVREPKDLILRSIVACLPAWWRFAQCVRRYFDEGRRANPHLLNAGKYSTVWLVVVFSTLTEYNQGELKRTNRILSLITAPSTS